MRKFTCALPSGELLKVKYAGPEPHGEVAASRLLLALGFGADHVGFVRRVRCQGCPWSPFATMAAVTLARAGGLYERVARSEQRSGLRMGVRGAPLRRVSRFETDSVEGWTFHEFASVRTASPTHADALRLLAVFLAHWDNKSENQRLVCLSGPPGTDGRCRTPLAMLQDVGATFGPRKVNLSAWRTATIWTDRARCEIGMPDMPHGGATFVPGADLRSRPPLPCRSARARSRTSRSLRCSAVHASSHATARCSDWVTRSGRASRRSPTARRARNETQAPPQAAPALRLR